MADGFVMKVTDPMKINVNQFNRFIARSGGVVENRVREASERLAERIRVRTPVKTGALQSGISVVNSGGTSNDVTAAVRFIIAVSSVEGGADREYSTYVEERFHMVEDAVNGFSVG